MSTILVIRGNSRSEKTTVANELYTVLGEGNLLISQDYVRRTMLKVKDRLNNLVVGLIQSMIDYGIENCDYTIVECIFANNKYGEMLRHSFEKADVVHAYYYDLSFEETIRRHHTKQNTDFNSEDMKRGFVPHDYLTVANEKYVSDTISKEKLLSIILKHLWFKHG